jgi:hypothetical protein
MPAKLLRLAWNRCGLRPARSAGNQRAPDGAAWLNCSSSVEPVNAVVEAAPPAMHWATWSK